jgi:predicted ATPase
VLGPLTEPQVAQMVAAAVRVPAADCAPLARLCFRKTAGNPFFLNQFLGTIHDAGHLRYRAGADCWDWDLAAIEQAEYTDNVAELLLEKIRRLPTAAQRLLQLAASIGNRFTLDTLALAVECDPWHTQQDLWPALDAGLIQPLDERYKYIDSDIDQAPPTLASATASCTTASSRPPISWWTPARARPVTCASAACCCGTPRRSRTESCSRSSTSSTPAVR